MKKDIQNLITQALEQIGLDEKITPQVTVPENPDHGDYSTNVAMVLSKQLKKNPREIAEDLKTTIQKHQTISDAGIIDRVEIALPGFINLYVTEASLVNQVSEVLKKGNAYGRVTKQPSIKATSVKLKPKNIPQKGQKSTRSDTSQAADLLQPKIDENSGNFPRKNDAGSFSARQNKKNKVHEKNKSSEFIPANTAGRVMIEFADPNPFKEIHIGHVRNIALGESFCRLMESQGHLVRRANYEGDVGLHVAKSLWGLTRLAGDAVDVSGVGLDVRGKAAILGRAYAVGSKAFESDETAKSEITALNTKIYRMEEDIRALWSRSKQWSLDYFDSVYARLGTHFDRYYFESEVAPIGLTLVEKHLSDKIFEKSEGAIVYKGEKAGLHTRVFVTKEHYATYEAKDLALAPLKYSEWPYDTSIIMTGNEQSEYFKVMLAALAEINPDLAARTIHIPFGMVRLTSGKMSSRTGDVITADWLIEEAKKRIHVILENNKTNYSKSEKDEIAEKAAIAAIKYSMLRVTSTSDIAFDIEASVSFEGDSGPYLQYTYARCKSVLGKAGVVSSSGLTRGSALSSKTKTDSRLRENDKLNPEERMIARSIIQFSDVVEESARNFASNTLCTYLFHLAQQYNLFYAKHPIIGSDTRIAITGATAQVLKNGLYLLGIETLEQM